MLTVQRTFTVDRPIETVFDYLADFTNTEAWDPGTVRTTRVDSGPLQSGARFHNVSNFRGRRTELDYELTTFDPRSHLTFTGNNKTVTSTDDLAFRPSGSGTEIHYAAHFDFHGLARLATPLLKSTFDKLADETVQQMTGVLESL
jgi:carbon monoxide dehydrogenase subunit G